MPCRAPRRVPAAVAAPLPAEPPGSRCPPELRGCCWGPAAPGCPLPVSPGSLLGDLVATKRGARLGLTRAPSLLYCAPLRAVSPGGKRSRHSFGCSLDYLANDIAIIFYVCHTDFSCVQSVYLTQEELFLLISVKKKKKDLAKDNQTL